MSIERVRAYFREYGREGDILEFPVSSATVELAAQAVGVIPARIAKTLSFLVDEKCVLIVAAGDAKVDNSKFKHLFHTKAKMLTPEQAVEMTGHAVGGVCPFANPEGVETYLDVSSLPRAARTPPLSLPARSWRSTPTAGAGSMYARPGRRNKHKKMP